MTDIVRNVLREQSEEAERFVRLRERIKEKTYTDGTAKHTAVLRSIDTFERKGINHMALRQAFFRMLWQNTRQEEKMNKENQ